MTHRSLSSALCALFFVATLALASPVSSCTGDFTASAGICNLYENGSEVVDLSLNGAPAGSIGLGALGILDPDGSLSDVLNFYDNADNTAHVTLYSDSSIPTEFLDEFESGTLAIGPTEDASGFASYNVGNVYNVHSDAVPEPASLSLLGLGLIGIGLKWRVRRG